MEEDTRTGTYSTQWTVRISPSKTLLVFKRDNSVVLTTRNFDVNYKLWDFPNDRHPSNIILKKYEAHENMSHS